MQFIARQRTISERSARFRASWLLVSVLTGWEDKGSRAEPGPAGGITTPSWPGSDQLSPSRRWRKLVVCVCVWMDGRIDG